MKRTLLSTLALATAMGMAACDSSPSSLDEEAKIRILLTDNPADYLATAFVWISRVYLIPGEEDPEEGPPFVDLFHDPENPLSYDLLTLRDGEIADVTGDVEVPARTFNQLRMVVDRAEVTLLEGYGFNGDPEDRTRELFVPSGAQTGIKVQLNESITTEAGTISVVLVDFDVDENFVMQGNPDTPAGIQGILFTPVLRELSRTVEEG